MRTIWKFPLAITDWQYVTMPSGGKILSVAVQRNVLCLWALVDSDVAVPLVNRVIYIAGTGHPAPPAYQEFVGTAIMADGALIWHVFDGGEA